MIPRRSKPIRRERSSGKFLNRLPRGEMSCMWFY